MVCVQASERRGGGGVSLQSIAWNLLRQPDVISSVRRRRIVLIAALVVAAAAVVLLRPYWHAARFRVTPPAVSDSIMLIEHPRTTAEKIVNGAKMEAMREVRYDSSYVRIPYPNGDVPKDQGACTDVIVRALRNAGCDLQKLMHEDMTAHFSAYPHNWGLRAPDSNIDHRRVPNQIAFMKRHGLELTKSTDGDAAKTWQPGDLVYWNLTPSITHCGVISNDRGEDGLPMVIHNIGPFTAQQACLTSWPIIGHFRYPVRP